MKLKRYGMVAGLVAGALALSACGSDNESDTPAASGGSGGGGAAADCADGTFNAVGSSAQNPAMTAWIQGYQAQCGSAAVNYDPQGSGNGRTQFIQKQVSLAGSDSALKEEQKTQADTRCAPGKAIDLPMVITPIAVVYNIEGVDKLTLTPSVIAKIFDGKITKWNDAAIAATNSGVTLPATSITTVHRATDSGTTENFTKFLVAQSKADWPYEAGQAWKASGGKGASNSAAMVQNVKGTDGAIGYVDNPDAKKNSLSAAAIDTGNGGVEITEESVAKAVDATEVKEDGSDIKLTINYGLKEAGAYPAILATYAITCSSGLEESQAKFVKSFLTYTASDAGQAALAPTGHIALPTDLRKKVQAAVATLGSA